MTLTMKTFDAWRTCQTCGHEQVLEIAQVRGQVVHADPCENCGASVVFVPGSEAWISSRWGRWWNRVVWLEMRRRDWLAAMAAGAAMAVVAYVIIVLSTGWNPAYDVGSLG